MFGPVIPALFLVIGLMVVATLIDITTLVG